jgi:hypothetical protein
MSKIKVLIAGDHTFVREGICRISNQEKGMKERAKLLGGTLGVDSKPG